jgi:hypothetical protein
MDRQRIANGSPTDRVDRVDGVVMRFPGMLRASAVLPWITALITSVNTLVQLDNLH